MFVSSAVLPRSCRRFDLITRNYGRKIDVFYIGVDETARRDRMMKKMLHAKTMEEVLHPKSVVVSEGAPNFLSRNKGHMKTIVKRQKMLNHHFMEGISDIIANDPLGDLFREENISVTQVEVGQHYNMLCVYWTTTKPNVGEIADKLFQLSGKFQKKMIEKKFMNPKLVPQIKFTFDQSRLTIESIENILKETGISSTSDPQAFVPPTQASTGFSFLDPLRPKFWAKRVAMYDERRKQEQERLHEEIEKKRESINRLPLKFEAPVDMAQNVHGLDYENLINQVLSRLKRTRAPKSSPHIGNALPPAKWVDDQTLPPDHLIQKSRVTTEERIHSMKQFIVDHKRKKNRLYRDHLKEEQEYLDHWQEVHKDAKDRIEYTYDKEDSYEFDYNEDNDKDAVK